MKTAAIALAAGAVLTVGGCRAARPASRPAPAQAARSGPSTEEKVVITIVFDNNAGAAGLETAWGFGCVVRGPEKTILFDTGGDGRILLANMKKLGIAPADIDALVISHAHGDHTGGLAALLAARGGVPVYIPAGAGASLAEQIRSHGAEPIEADASADVCDGAKTTGTLGKGAIEEHGLCVKTAAGWVLITGCAHPGAAVMAAKATEVTAGALELVVGGFHMGSHSKAQIDAVIDEFEKLAVRRAAPCHCSGDNTRKQFQQRYGQRCSLVGVGAVFDFAGE